MLTAETVLQNRYRILHPVGQGGMGTVYKAVDQRFDNTVALKETFFSDELLRKAFEREARLLNSLRHSVLPVVMDYFSEGDGQFLVMQFIPGEDFGELLRQQNGAFQVQQALGWADQLLDALDYLHTQTPPVIHRDIKPQNLKLTSRGQIVLLDFGLAKGTALQVSRATTTGSIFGYTPNYAPLEQIQGAGTDARSDLYSLGATVYHLLTGTPPPDVLSRAAAVLNGQPDPLRPARQFNSQVSSNVSDLLKLTMSLNRDMRPRTAAEMRAALAHADMTASPARRELAEPASASPVNVAAPRPAHREPISSNEVPQRVASAPDSARSVLSHELANSPTHYPPPEPTLYSPPPEIGPTIFSPEPTIAASSYPSRAEHAEPTMHGVAPPKLIANTRDLMLIADNYYRSRRYTEAVQAYHEVIRLEPDSAKAQYSLGAAYYSMERYTDAVAALEQAVALKHDYAAAHYDLGLAYLALDDLDRASRQYHTLKPLNRKWANDLYQAIRE